MVALLTVHRLCVPPTHVVKNCAYWKLPVFQNFLYMEELHIKKKKSMPHIFHIFCLSALLLINYNLVLMVALR